MDLLKYLRAAGLFSCILFVLIQSSSSRYHGKRHKRQYGAHMYLPESYIVPNGEGEAHEWSDWSSPSECSRSCGGGVSFQTRECLSYRSKGMQNCIGGSRKYFSCNTQDCPDEDPDFRAQQCSRFDNVPFDGVRYQWVPYTNAPNPCELNCMPRGERFYYRHKAKVIDGTRCNDKSLDVCVDGECKPVGCDMMLGSNAREDKCRKCAGDGSSCKTISGSFDTNDLAAGYNDILLIPTGATNIVLKEKEPSNNYLACRNLTGHFYLNGNWRIDFPRPMLFAGSWWHYQRKPTGFAAPDQLTCSGPTTETIYIVMLIQDRNVGVKYEYSIPETVSKNFPDTYSWTHMEFGPCSVSCGGGTQSRNVTCNNRLTLEEVDESLCDANTKPNNVQACGTEECAPSWVEKPWGKCSKSCGKDGTQNRTVSCERISPNGSASILNDSVCLNALGSKPAETRDCNRDIENCPKFHIGPWTPCNKLCGEGKRTRKVTCFKEEDGKKKILPSEECSEEKPNTEEVCMLAPCEGVDWIVSQWSGCEKCGQTKETRTALCGSKTGKVYDDKFCLLEKPSLIRPCSSVKCKIQWFTSQWSECSAKCGTGIQSRIVICAEFDGLKLTRALDESECNSLDKPSTEQKCEGDQKDCPGEWFTGPWGECSKICGGGQRYREVLCLANGSKASNCEESKIEFGSENCNTEPCTDDELIPIDTNKSIEDEFESGEDCDEDEDEYDKSELPPTKIKENLEVLEGSDIDITDGSGEGSGETDTDITSENISTVFESTSDSKVDSTTDDPNYTTTVTTLDTTFDSSSTKPTDLFGSTETLQTTEAATEINTDLNTYNPKYTTLEGDLETTFNSGSTTPDNVFTSVATNSDTTESANSDKTTETSNYSTTEDGTPTTPIKSTDTTFESSSQSSEYPVTSSVTNTDASQTTEEVTTSESSTISENSESTTESTTEINTSSTFEETESTTPSTDITSEISSQTSDLTTESSQTTEDTTTSSYANTESTTEINTDSTSDESTTPSSITDTTFDSSSQTTDISMTGSDSSTDTSKTTEESTSSDFTTSESSTISATSDSIQKSTTEMDVDSTSEIEDNASTISSTDFTQTSNDITGSTNVDDLSTSSITEQTTIQDTDESTTIISTQLFESIATDLTTVDIWESEENYSKTTPNSINAVIEMELKPKSKKCKPRKPKKLTCTLSKFGCCPDKKTHAKGPFGLGCPVIKTCSDSKFGCCLDGLSPSQGTKYEGCPTSLCAETLFGCCLDKFTPSEGEDYEGCPSPTTIPPTTNPITTTKENEETSLTTDLTQSSFELSTEPNSNDFTTQQSVTELTDATEGTEEPTVYDENDCTKSSFGCCKDRKTSARGPNEEGCPLCSQEPYGCCPDGLTPAHGELGEGCCLNTQYGCCPDNIQAATGPSFQGCSCANTAFGCCPDNITASRGYNNEGCGCESTKFGCCPDKITVALGPKFSGCPCHTMQFGCCPDGITISQGPHHYGCYCSQTQFKCCSDEKTPAKGLNYEGCTCAESKFGCCPDGITEAQGHKFEGCKNVIESPQKSCGLPKDQGRKCSNFAIKYFFDTSYGACTRFWYGGCDGNGNRFETESECKNTCQEYSGKDKCLLPKNSGPCPGSQKKWYFDSDRNRCEEFNYGGCYGTSNRFDTIEECRAQCSVEESLPPCEQPMDKGPCDGNFERWFHDNETNTCRPFTYGGCKGNKNNYKTEHACNYHCRQPGVHKDYSTKPSVTKCESAVEQCRMLQCPFGVRSERGADGCERCDCFNPCADHTCSSEEKCTVDISSDPSSKTKFLPICREVNKNGICPKLSNSSDCRRECYDDADCRDDNKCCSEGCNHVCVRPYQPSLHPTTVTPIASRTEMIQPGESAASLEPKTSKEVEVTSSVGSTALLRCFATGNPPPVVTWKRGAILIDTNNGRFILSSSGDLSIVQVHQSDSGSYICVASNGLGAPVSREVNLQVPVSKKNIPAYIHGPKNITQIVTLKQPAMIRCPAGGYPKPHVNWWRGKTRMPYTTLRYDTKRDYSLVFRSIELTDLGPYECSAWTGHGKPASKIVILKAVGPVHDISPKEPYLKYIIDPATLPSTSKPVNSFNPQLSKTGPSQAQVVDLGQNVITPPPYKKSVAATALLRRDSSNNYTVGSDIVLTCIVEGYPTPNVAWFKDSKQLFSSNRVQITENPHRLLIFKVTAEDSGYYKCTARNTFSFNTSEEKVLVESGEQVSADCTDNILFANCALIVKGRYCSNSYYRKFCCRSCTLAGQLPGGHPNSL
ncbi:papilin isoform X3 [Eupeodes corollae]|uniref:papilin isoform X3 n=1 Tax=Eupeodes corollae TaxID=290404 RepID=UPI0024924EEB|nr:papilin isoform X3 [Eupeodes corollae]